MILTFCNQKGGVGKSTTAYNLARAAVVQGKRVLVVDADPQGNLTSVLAHDVPEDAPTLADALSTRSPLTITDVLWPGIWEGLTVVPTVGESLGSVRDELIVAAVARESRLRNELTPLRSDYDLILIDCGPNLDQLVVNALTASDAAVIVTQSKLWSANGLAKLVRTIQGVKDSYNPKLHVAGIILNQHEAKTVGGGHWAEQIAEAAAGNELPLLAPPVPKRQIISDVTESSQGLDEAGPQGRELAAIYDGYLATIAEGATND